MYAQGYFSQRISEDGWQEAFNNPLDLRRSARAAMVLDKDEQTRHVSKWNSLTEMIALQIWEVRVGRVPLYLLDSNVEGNSDI